MVLFLSCLFILFSFIQSCNAQDERAAVLNKEANETTRPSGKSYTCRYPIKSTMAAAAAPADPLDAVRDVLAVVGFGLASANRFILAHDLSGMDDFEFMPYDDVQQIAKIYNDRQTGNNANRKIGYPVQWKLQGFLYWYQDRQQR